MSGIRESFDPPPRVVVEYVWDAAEGHWLASVCELRACWSVGSTVEEARRGIVLSMGMYGALARCTWTERFTGTVR